MTTGAVLAGFYDYRLVALSVFISIVACYAALDLSERGTTARGKIRLAWLWGGAAPMGIGIWAMHYIGMLAFHLPIPVQYDWPTVLLSLLVAILASGVALFVVSRPTMGMVRAILGSVIMGSGIAGMHYIGMEAMRLKAMCVYSPGIVVLSVALAVAISFVALKLAFAQREDRTRWGERKILSAVIMGLAIPIMHYVGMAAATFVPDPALRLNLANSVSISRFGLASLSFVTLVILVHVSIVSGIDRRFAAKEQELTQSQVQLQIIFDNMSEGIAVLDSKGNVSQMNKAAALFFGLPREQIEREKLKDLLDAFTPDGEFLPLDQRPGAMALRGQFVKDHEIALRPRTTGQTRIAEVSTAPIPSPSGAARQVIVSYRDITDRKRTDETQARLAAIVESSEDAIIGKDLQGTVTAWNRGAERTFGYTSEEMIGTPIRRLLPAGAEQEEDEILARIAHGDTVDHFETVRKRKDGQIIHVSLTISPIRNSRGEVVGASKIVRDITARRLMERQLHQSQKMEALGQLTGGIAHDFNNLLGVILGNLDLLERMLPGNDAALKRVQTTQRAAIRGAELTRRLLTTSSRGELNPAPLSLRDALHELVELASRTLGPEIRITTHCEEQLPPVFVDAAGLESALLNLVVNARDAMPRGGSLTFRSDAIDLGADYPAVQTGELKPGRYACISVSDSGPGMSKETMERAFEPFFTTKPRNKGTGLGLAMVYGFMKQSGGAVRLYSEEGYGTTVSLYLPLADEPLKLSRETGPAQEPLKLGGTVLVVDDEAPLLEIAEAFLTDMGFTVLQAEDSTAALNIAAQAGAIDLLVTDIIMPGKMNGIELAQKVSELRPGIRVIFTSGFPAEALAERSGKLVAGPLLHKPYLRAEFTAIIGKTMQEKEPDSRSDSPVGAEERLAEN